MTDYNYLVQNVDKNESTQSISASLKNEDSLKISNIFMTLQGEMPYSGEPAVFLRLAGCNRGAKVDSSCSFCDTSFSVKDAREMTEQDVFDEIYSKKAPRTKLLVITGGEPFLQYNNLVKLLERLHDHVMYLKSTQGDTHNPITHIQFETNGDRLREMEKLFAHLQYLDNLNCSIVISPQGGLTPARVNSLETMIDRSRVSHAYPFKFYLRRLISASDPVYMFTDKTYKILEYLIKSNHLTDVYLSPITEYRHFGPIKHYQNSVLVETAPQKIVVDTEKSKLNANKAVEICMKYGFKLSTQTHIELGLE